MNESRHEAPLVPGTPQYPCRCGNATRRPGATEPRAPGDQPGLERGTFGSGGANGQRPPTLGAAFDALSRVARRLIRLTTRLNTDAAEARCNCSSGPLCGIEMSTKFRTV